MVEGNLVKNCLADRQKIINKINTDKLIIGVCVVVLILVLITFFGYTKGKDTFMIYLLDFIILSLTKFIFIIFFLYNLEFKLRTKRGKKPTTIIEIYLTKYSNL